jgi:hypothetical protein
MRLFNSLAVILLLANAPMPGRAQTAPLKGLAGVSVSVAIDSRVPVKPDLQDAVQRDAEIKLRVAGMEILPQRDGLKKPRLSISISSYSPGAFFGLIVAFSEPAFLERDPTLRVQAATWVRDGVVFSVDENEIRRMFKDMIDEFLNDWLIANPKPR